MFEASEALDRVDGDKEFLAELVGIFFGTYPSDFAGLTAAADGGDLAAVEARAHSMKSALGNLGARSSAEVCGLIEKMGRERDGSRLREELRRLDDEVGKFKSATTDFFGK